MVQLADLFSVPEMCLLCNVIEYFNQIKQIDYNPEIVFHDVRTAMASCHPIMHATVMKNTEKYIERNAKLVPYFQKLQKSGKNLFLVTNSPFSFV